MLKAKYDAFEGFYAGLGGGYSYQEIRDNYSQVNDKNDTFNETDNISQELAIGQAFVGYGFKFPRRFERLYLGTELSFNLYSDGSSFTPKDPSSPRPNVTKSKVSPLYGFQASLLPGVYVSSTTLLYGRVGFGLERYDAHFETDIRTVPNKKNSSREWAPEYILGVSLQQKIWDNFSLRAECNYIATAIFDGPRGDTVVPRTGRLLNQHKNDYRAMSNNVLVSVAYHFGG